MTHRSTWWRLRRAAIQLCGVGIALLAVVAPAHAWETLFTKVRMLGSHEAVAEVTEGERQALRQQRDELLLQANPVALVGSPAITVFWRCESDENLFPLAASHLRYSAELHEAMRFYLDDEWPAWTHWRIWREFEGISLEMAFKTTPPAKVFYTQHELAGYGENSDAYPYSDHLVEQLGLPDRATWRMLREGTEADRQDACIVLELLGRELLQELKLTKQQLLGDAGGYYLDDENDVVPRFLFAQRMHHEGVRHLKQHVERLRAMSQTAPAQPQRWQTLAMGNNASPQPQWVDLWLSAPPADGNLQACTADVPARQWRLAVAAVQLSVTGAGHRLQRLGQEAAQGEAMTQRCFQLRVGEQVLVQGAVVPTASARRLHPPLWVLALENRARYQPEMVLACGFPAWGGDAQACGQAWPFMMSPGSTGS